MDFFRVAAFVPLAAAWLILWNSPALMTAIVNFIRNNTDFSTTLEIFDFIWSDWSHLFKLLLILRYYRLVVHILAYLFWYKASPVPAKPTVTPEHVHVIIPTVDAENEDFLRCITSVLAHKPANITVVTANEGISRKARVVLAHLFTARSGTRIEVETGPMANKRHQVTHVLNALAKDMGSNKDTIVVFVDDHVWWPSPNFLVNLIAPLEDKEVGVVATNKRVQRERGNTFADSFLNFIACAYLERHNFEMTAANAIDGGIFVVSGRTCAVRASIILREDFREGFTNERFFFNRFGPLNPDDDNYVTRFIVRSGWKIKLQNMGYDTLMETTLGTTGGYKKFRGQLLRWARSQWRSNSATLFRDRAVWTKQPWSVHAIFVTWFFNFALPCDALLLYLWHKSNSEWVTIYHMLALIWGSKMVKLIPFFWRNPQDLLLFPAYVLFAYFHSFIKLWSLITFWDHSWGGRNLAAISTAPVDSDDNDDADKDASAPKPTDSRRSSTYRTPYAEPASNSCYSSSLCEPTTPSLSTRSQNPTPVKTADFTTFRVRSVSPTWTQSSKTMSISSGSSGTSNIGRYPISPPFASTTSSIATSNTMLDKYSKLRPGETTNGFSPEGSFCTGSDPLIHFHPATSSTASLKSIPTGAPYPNKQPSPTYYTPWGAVNTPDPHLTPVNIRQSQSPTLSPPRAPKGDFFTKLTESSLNVFDRFSSTINPPSTPLQPIGSSPITSPSIISTDARFPISRSMVNETPGTSPLSHKYGYTGAQTNNGQATDPYNPLPTPYSIQTRHNSSTIHFHDPFQTCHHSSPHQSHNSQSSTSSTGTVIRRTHYHEPAPSAPPPIPNIYKSGSPQGSIANNGSQAHNPDLEFQPDPTGYASNATKHRGQKYQYSRDFIKGYDCQRIHADGTMLSAPRYFEGGRMCRTPPMNRVPIGYVVPGRPRF